MVTLPWPRCLCIPGALLLGAFRVSRHTGPDRGQIYSTGELPGPQPGARHGRLELEHLVARSSRVWLWQQLNQKHGCGRSLLIPWNMTFGQPQSEFDKLSGDSRGECSALQWEWGGSDLWDSLLRVLLPQVAEDVWMDILWSHIHRWSVYIYFRFSCSQWHFLIAQAWKCNFFVIRNVVLKLLS